MALTDIVKSIGRKTAIGTIALASYLSSYSAARGDKFVDNTMDYTTINSTIASATSGEDVHFAAGTYQLPQISGADYLLNNSGVDWVADGEVILRGATITSGKVIRVLSTNNTINGFTIENSRLGILLDAN